MSASPVAQVCEFGCGRPAMVYGGFPAAGDWAGYACAEHASAPGFAVWDHVSAAKAWVDATIPAPRPVRVGTDS